MTDKQIEEMKAILKREDICWVFDNAVRQIVSIGPARLVEGEDPEPSEVGYFANGEYIALWNCEVSEFVTLHYIWGRRRHEDGTKKVEKST